MAEIQQQIADGARPRLARVGDVIEHGQDIPAKVVWLEDADARQWKRTPAGHWHTSEDAIEACETSECYEDSTWKMQRRYPMTVVEVDPEPQPAEDDRLPERQCASEARHGGHTWGGAFGRVWCPGYVGRAGVTQPESGPLVLTLPVVPPEAVALYGLRTGTRYKLDAVGVWRVNSWDGDLADVLRREHPEGARVEMAPPREARTWPKLDPAPDDVKAVEVEGMPDPWWAMPDGKGGFRQYTDGQILTLGHLRQLGEVREVLT